MKIATYVIDFNQDQWIMRNIENAYPHVDRIYVLHNFLPLTHNPWARNMFRNTADLDIIRNSKYMDKIVIIQDNWDTDSNMRNAAFLRVKNDGFDYLFSQDADEFFFHKDFEKIIETVKNNPTVDMFEIAAYVFWKSFNYIIINCDGTKISGIHPSIVNLKTVEKYDYFRDVNTSNRLGIDDVICYHGSYVRTDQEAFLKVMSFGHAADFDAQKWYDEVWIPWTLESRDLHPIWPWAWPHCEVFTGDLPEVIADLKHTV